MKAQIRKEERIDIRVSSEEKDLFLHAQQLSGDSSLSSFVTRVLKDKSSEIIAENNKILASEKDAEVFFSALFADAEPNETLKNAAARFKSSQK